MYNATSTQFPALYPRGALANARRTFLIIQGLFRHIRARILRDLGDQDRETLLGSATNFFLCWNCRVSIDRAEELSRKFEDVPIQNWLVGSDFDL